MMKVKRTLCTECKHPLDNHSAYRPTCLHEDCSCKVDIPDGGATGFEYLPDTLSQLNQLERGNDGDVLGKVLEVSGV